MDLAALIPAPAALPAQPAAQVVVQEPTSESTLRAEADSFDGLVAMLLSAVNAGEGEALLESCGLPEEVASAVTHSIESGEELPEDLREQVIQALLAGYGAVVADQPATASERHQALATCSPSEGSLTQGTCITDKKSASASKAHLPLSDERGDANQAAELANPAGRPEMAGIEQIQGGNAADAVHSPAPAEQVRGEQQDAAKYQADSDETPASAASSSTRLGGSQEETAALSQTREGRPQEGDSEQPRDRETVSDLPKADSGKNAPASLHPHETLEVNHARTSEGPARSEMVDVQVHQDELASGIGHQLKLLVDREGGAARIAITPEHLGRIELEVTVGEQGTTAVIIAEQRQTAELIEANVEDLREVLRQNGVNLEECQVELRQDDQSHHANEEQRNRHDDYEHLRLFTESFGLVDQPQIREQDFLPFSGPQRAVAAGRVDILI